MPGKPVRSWFLLAILLLGWALRLYGLDWDQGIGAHPDERYITWVAASLHPSQGLDGLNPYAWPPDGRPAQERARPFSYGHLPLYLLALVSGGDGDEARLALVGRVLSALFDTLTLALTFALGRELYDWATGALAAAFVSLTPLHLQLAHFATFDTYLTCFVVATLLFAARLARCERRRDALAAGLGLGLAVGSKFSAILLLAPLLMACALRQERSLRTLALALVVALLAFGLTNPLALLQPGAFMDNLRTQGAMLRGGDEFVFTRQYHDTWPWLYPIEQQLRWGLGLPLGLAAWGGLAWALLRARKHPPSAAEWVLLAWVSVYFGFTGNLYVKFVRYMLPLAPALAVYGARLLVRTRRASLAALVVLPTLLYALAWLNVYRGEHPWLKLSRWIYQNAPPGASIAYEEWDHHLPVTLYQAGALRWPGEYQQAALDLYAADTPLKLRALLEQLAASDYVVIASNRLYGSVGRWPERYPLTRRYYQLLFGGELGYRLLSVPGVERHPQLGPVALLADPFEAAGLVSPLPPARERPAPLTLRLGRADESWSVYDHPRPLLLQNVERLTVEQMELFFADLNNLLSKCPCAIAHYPAPVYNKSGTQRSLSCTLFRRTT